MKPVDAFLNPATSSIDAAAAAAIETAIQSACAAIAPTWPLDRFIAVNPYWGWIDHHFDEAAMQLQHLSGTSLRMPREYYRSAWHENVFSRADLSQALTEYRTSIALDDAIAALDLAASPTHTLPLLSDMLDADRDLEHAPAWRDTITHEISQFCAAYFDADQADWHLVHEGSILQSWRAKVARDHGIALLMQAPEVATRAAHLPLEARQTIVFVLERLAVPAAEFADFLTTVLLRAGGWAAWCAYLRWQARLNGTDDDHIVDLLAMRLAWEYLLDDGKRDAHCLWSRWRHAFRLATEAVVQKQAEPNVDAAFQRALEIAYQRKVTADLLREVSKPAAPANGTAPTVQAVFCIDVRSEVFRRALESTSPDIHTEGFAGFFGLPVRYIPLGTTADRPQLPGLLAPQLTVTESCGHARGDDLLAASRRKALVAKRTMRGVQRAPASAFTLVEALGLGYLLKLMKRALPSLEDAASSDRFGADFPAHARPVLRIEGDDALQQKIALAARILKAMNLVDPFARIVLLTGHGSQSANNPHAAGLDCGACCGQTGEINARALAFLLNEGEVRSGLIQLGHVLPADTHFLAALHNTMTDEVLLFDTDTLPPGHTDDLNHLRDALEQAGKLARAERAASLGLANFARNAGKPEALLRRLKRRANDWSETRPEWGLANNAAFIAAPRARTRNINLHGRAFLHDYDWKTDPDHSVLELILTAPMVVANWINMQYYASTVDNLRFGSGNKLLHNVVGGHIGVFEGNGGDLRIGLPLQSLHDGRNWMHTPLRLSVFVEAPKDAIAAIVEKHEAVKSMVDNEWLYLFQIDETTRSIARLKHNEWHIPAWSALVPGDS
ncbi:MAG TPA: DUF2309 domain-containing protein [Burkholderiaceae bacterium]